MRSDKQYKQLIILQNWLMILEKFDRHSIVELQLFLHEQKQAFISTATINKDVLNQFIKNYEEKNILPEVECEKIKLAIEELENKLLAPHATILKIISFALTTQTPFATGYTAYHDLPKPGLDPAWSEIGSVFVGAAMLAIQWQTYYFSGINSLSILNSLQMIFERGISTLLLKQYGTSELTHYKKISPAIHFALPLLVAKLSESSESNTFNQFFTLYLLLKSSQFITGKIINYFLPKGKNNALHFFAQTAATLITCLLLFPYLYNMISGYFFTNELATRDSILLTRDSAALFKQRFNLSDDATCNEMREIYKKEMRKNNFKQFDRELVEFGSSLRSCGK